MPIFDRPVSGRETLSQLVFVLALHFVQHLDGSPPGHGQPVQTHCCSYLQPQRWPTSAHVMSRPGSDDSPGSSPLAALDLRRGLFLVPKEKETKLATFARGLIVRAKRNLPAAAMTAGAAAAVGAAAGS